MMPNLGKVLVSLCILIFAGTALAQSPDIEIKDLSLPGGGWGDKKISFKAFNHDDHIRFIVVKSVLDFKGLNSSYKSENRFSGFLEPGYWFEMEPVVTVPGNYGTATITLEFHDVVDTLDTVLPGQKFFDTAFTIVVETPESARPWLEKAVVFPPRVDEHPYFDNQFVRMMYAMIGEGMSRGDISRITGGSMDFVDANISRMAGDLYIKRKGITLEPTFPIVPADEADQAVKLVDQTAAKLESVVTGNCAGYEDALDSLIQAGVLAGDSGNVLGPERILFHKYVVVSVLLLWHELGAQFITDGTPLAPFTGTDICNAKIRNFMYAAPPGERYNGHHFYALLRDGGSGRLVFAGHPPKIICEGNFPAKRGVAAKAVWKNDPEDKPEYFIYNSNTAQPIVDMLKSGTNEIVTSARADLEKMSVENGRGGTTAGYRYWFWNLVASKTLDSLVEQKVVEPYNSDNYILGIRGGM